MRHCELIVRVVDNGWTADVLQRGWAGEDMKSRHVFNDAEALAKWQTELLKRDGLRIEEPKTATEAVAGCNNRIATEKAQIDCVVGPGSR